MAGGRKQGQESEDRLRQSSWIRAFSRSLESDWTFSFLRFACTPRGLSSGMEEPFLRSKRESSFLSSGIISFKIPISFLCSERSLNKAETPPHESISFKLQTAPIYQRYHTKTKLVKNDKKTPQLFQQPYFVVNKITNERRSKMKTLHTSTCA
jgi:hypothetical protein